MPAERHVTIINDDNIDELIYRYFTLVNLWNFFCHLYQNRQSFYHLYQELETTYTNKYNNNNMVRSMFKSIVAIFQ